MRIVQVRRPLHKTCTHNLMPFSHNACTNRIIFCHFSLPDPNMYRTTTRERTFEKKKFNEFKRRSFYDMQVNFGFVSDMPFSDMVTNALFLSWTRRQGRSSTLVKLPLWASATSPTCRPCFRASEATPLHALHVPDMQDILQSSWHCCQHRAGLFLWTKYPMYFH